MKYGFNSEAIAQKMIELETDAVAAFEFETEFPLETICETLPVDEASQAALIEERNRVVQGFYRDLDIN